MGTMMFATCVSPLGSLLLWLLGIAVVWVPVWAVVRWVKRKRKREEDALHAQAAARSLQER